MKYTWQTPVSVDHLPVVTRLCQIMGFAESIASKSYRALDSPIKLGLH